MKRLRAEQQEKALAQAGCGLEPHHVHDLTPVLSWDLRCCVRLFASSQLIFPRSPFPPFLRSIPVPLSLSRSRFLPLPLHRFRGGSTSQNHALGGPSG